MILGDLNAYSQEDPMQAFYSAGFTNLKYTEAATEEQPYSYTFSGLLGSLDHALVLEQGSYAQRQDEHNADACRVI